MHFKAFCKEQAETYICPSLWHGARAGCSTGTSASIRSSSDPVIFLPKCALDQLTEPKQRLIHRLSKLLAGQHCNSWEQDGIWAGARKKSGEGRQRSRSSFEQIFWLRSVGCGVKQHNEQGVYAHIASYLHCFSCTNLFLLVGCIRINRW